MTEDSTPTEKQTWIVDLPEHIDQEVILRAWVANRRSSGKIGFLQLRDGSGVVQAVVSRAEVSEEAWEVLQQVTQESTLEVRGTVSADKRSPTGVEVHARELVLLSVSEEFPITPKEHGTAFLMAHRHLWLRSSRQRAVLQVRSEATQAIRDLLLPARLLQHRLADPHPGGLRGHVDVVRDRLLR